MGKLGMSTVDWEEIEEDLKIPKNRTLQGE